MDKQGFKEKQVVKLWQPWASTIALLREAISNKRINRIAREKAEAYQRFTRKLKKRKGKKTTQKRQGYWSNYKLWDQSLPYLRTHIVWVVT